MAKYRYGGTNYETYNKKRKHNLLATNLVFDESRSIRRQVFRRRYQASNNDKNMKIFNLG